MNLPTTSYVILGMLSAEERSGYDLKLLLDKHLHHVYWSPAKSQIYSELRRLEREGLATMTEVPQTTRPDKRVYQITDAGRAALQAWLASAATEPDVFKSALLVHLFFGHLVPGPALITQIEARQHTLVADLAKCEARVQDFQSQLQAPKADPQLPFVLLTLQFQMNMLRAAITWTTDTMTQLKRTQGKSTSGRRK